LRSKPCFFIISSRSSLVLPRVILTTRIKARRDSVVRGLDLRVCLRVWCLCEVARRGVA